MSCILPVAAATRLARPDRATLLGYLFVSFIVIKYSNSQELLIGANGDPGAQFVQALQNSSPAVNLSVVLPAGVRVNVSGLSGDPPGSAAWLSGRLHIRGESAELQQLPQLDCGFLSEGTVSEADGVGLGDS